MHTVQESNCIASTGTQFSTVARAEGIQYMQIAIVPICADRDFVIECPLKRLQVLKFEFVNDLWKQDWLPEQNRKDLHFNM